MSPGDETRPMYHRVLLKLSGEAFAPESGTGISIEATSLVASQLADVVDLGIQTALPQDFVEEALVFDVEPSLEGYDDPALRGDMGRLRVDLPWDGPERVDRAR